MQKNESKVSSDKELEHPTTLKIYLYLKSKYPKNLGTREIQRELNFKSPSIVSWHLEKLHVGAYVEKLPSNRYKLTQKEAQRQTLNIPLKVSVKLFKGLIISSILLISGFLTIIGIIS